MNKYCRAMFCVPFGFLKMSCLKLFHIKNFQGTSVSLISPFTEITLDYGGILKIGKLLKMRDGAKIRVRKNAECIIGNRVLVNSNNLIVCREKIVIGDDVQLAPNVQIYDHDHDFRVEGGVKVGKYKTSPVTIGNNVWIGANSVILRGTKIGDNCVIAAGSIVKGILPDNTLYIQKKDFTTRKIINEN